MKGIAITLCCVFASLLQVQGHPRTGSAQLAFLRDHQMDVEVGAYAVGDRPVRYDGHQVIRVHRVDPALLEQLHAWQPPLDIWGEEQQHQPLLDVDMLVSPEQLQQLQESLRDRFAYSVLDDNVQLRIDAETTRLQQASAVRSGDDKEWFDDYHPLEEIRAWYRALAVEHPTLVTILESIGTSVEGRDLFALRITSPVGDRTAKKQIYFQGQIHAREWISGATVQYFVHHLLSGYRNNATSVRKMLDEVEFLVVPVVNPDGYVYTWSTNRLWRKNRRQNNAFAYGVDLNRNWNANWDAENGASRSPLSETYKGPAVASEPEVQAISRFFLANPRIIAGIDFHAYSQLILRPYGYTDKVAPHEKQHRELGELMKNAIAQTHGKQYTSTPSIALYPTTGTASDWFYGEEVAQAFGHHVYGYTIELRPSGMRGGSGFILPPEEIRPTGEEITAAMYQFVRYVTANPLD